MNIFVNKKNIEFAEVKNNNMYQFIELNDIKNVELNSNSDCEIFITDSDKYIQGLSINWLSDGLENYYNNLKNGEYTFINCDMYDDFLNFKISIRKEKDKLYLNSIKHIINLKELLNIN